METSNSKMVLRVGDIIETSGITEKFGITKITKTRICYNVYSPDRKVVNIDYDKRDFESYKWKRAKMKWY